jgi:hypothetical protein
MAVADFTNPKLTQDYTTLLQSIRDMQSSQALMHDSTGAVNVPTGTIRWSSSNNRDEKFNGSVWVPKSSTYSIDVSTLATYSPSQSATNSTVAVRDTSGNILATGFSSSSANNASAVTFVMTKNGSNFINPSTAAQVKTFLAYTGYDIVGMTLGHGLNGESSSVAFGNNSLAASTSSTGNTAIGHYTLQLNTSGINNVAVGNVAMFTNVTGSDNTCVGVAAYQMGTGSGNTAIGRAALYGTTSPNNVGVGHRAGEANSSGTLTAVGYRALTSSTTGSSQTAFGYAALAANASSQNTAVGSAALNTATSTGNTAVGAGTLNSVTAGALNTAIGHQAGTGVTTESNTTCLGYNAQVGGSNQVQLGDSSTTTYCYGAIQNRSDIRDKANIRETILGLDFINKIRPVDFQWDMREFYVSHNVDDNSVATKAPTPLSQITPDGSKKRTRYHHGVIAQEVQAIIESTGVDFGGFQNHSKNGGDDVLSIGYEEFIAPLIKAVQELSAKNNSREALLVALESRLSVLEAKL